MEEDGFRKLIIDGISRHIKLSTQELDYFLSFWQSRLLKRREILLQEGQVCRQIAFVVQGCLRSFAVSGVGVEHVLAFAPAGWWMSDMQSFITGAPGRLSIDALEPTAIYILHKDDREKLLAEIPLLERYFRILVERSMVSNHQRLLDTLILPATERYLNFCHYYPGLVDKLSQKQIASYIGVTPEFFSKMRSEMLRK